MYIKINKNNLILDALPIPREGYVKINKSNTDLYLKNCNANVKSKYVNNFVVKTEILRDYRGDFVKPKFNEDLETWEDQATKKDKIKYKRDIAKRQHKRDVSNIDNLLEVENYQTQEAYINKRDELLFKAYRKRINDGI